MSQLSDTSAGLVADATESGDNKGWGTALTAAICEQCDWRYLLPTDTLSRQCPHCRKASLTPLADRADGSFTDYSPELVVPFSVPDERLNRKIEAFSRGIWFAPQDLKVTNLKRRL